MVQCMESKCYRKNMGEEEAMRNKIVFIKILLISFILSFSCKGTPTKTCIIDPKVTSNHNHSICSPSSLSYIKTVLNCENSEKTDSVSLLNFTLSILKRDTNTADCIISSTNDIGKLNMMLIVSSESGQIKLVKMLIEKGASVNHQEEWTGKTALFFASINGHKKVVSLLIKNGAGINIKDHDKRTILTYKDDFCSTQAFPKNDKCNKQGMIKLLLKNSAMETVKLFPDDSMSLKENYSFSSYFEKLGENPLSSFPDDAFRIFYVNHGTTGFIRFDKNEAVLKEIVSGKESRTTNKITEESWQKNKQIFKEIYNLEDSVTALDGDSFWFFEGRFNGSYRMLFIDNLSGEIGNIYKKLESFVKNEKD